MGHLPIGTNNVHPFPAVKPGHRLVPAKIGRTNATSVIVFVECPNWCGEDHVVESQVAVEDIVHVSTASAVVVRSFLQGGNVLDLYASIKAEASPHDPQLHAAHVVVDDCSNDAHLSPEMAESLADELIGFASDLRQLARTVRLHNQSNGDSDPTMDEALRRVREGGVA